MTAIVPERKLAEIINQSHHTELIEFAHEYAASKGHAVLSVSSGTWGPTVKARTKEGYEREFTPVSLEKIAAKVGHRFKFTNPPTSNAIEVKHGGTVAIDFDGRIADADPVPLADKRPREGAAAALRLFKSWGLKILIWSANQEWQSIPAWLDKWGICYDAVNYVPGDC